MVGTILNSLFVLISSNYIRYHTHLTCREFMEISVDECGCKEINILDIEMTGVTRISRPLHTTIQTEVLIETLKDLGNDLLWCS